MSACQVCDFSFLGIGGESSSSMLEPHCLTVQSGASRSVSPVRLWTERRLLEERRTGSDSWYLSAKREEGRVR